MQTHSATRAGIMEPSTTAGAEWAAVKIAAGFAIPAALAAVLGLLILPPKTAREFIIRSTVTVICSFIFGPLLAALLASWVPGLFDATHWLAERSGLNFPELSMFYVLGPCMLIAGLPSWWLLGAYMRWTSRLQHQDALSWVSDILNVVRGRK